MEVKELTIANMTNVEWTSHAEEYTVETVKTELALDVPLVEFMEEAYIENVRSTADIDIVGEVVALSDSLIFDFGIQATPVVFTTTTGEPVTVTNHLTGEKVSVSSYATVAFGELMLDILYSDKLLVTSKVIIELMQLNPNLTIDQENSCWISAAGELGIPTLEEMRDYKAPEEKGEA